MDPTAKSTVPRPQEIIDLNYWNTTEEKVVNAFTVYAPNYDECMALSQYFLPSTMADLFDEQLIQHFPGLDKDRAKILDVGAGTGMFGEQLQKRGYRDICALDICAEMLKISREKNIYKKTICLSVYNWREHFQPGEFDAVTACNTFTPGQMKPGAIEEITKIVRVGGIIALSIRKDSWETKEFGYSDKITEMEQEKKLRLIKKKYVQRYADPKAHEYTVPFTYVLVYTVLKHD